MLAEKLAVVVLGAHRSGTSAITSILSISGFTLPRTLLPTQPDNAAGVYESAVIVDLNDELLAMGDASWHELFPPDDAPLLSNSGAVALAKAEAALAAEFGDATNIVLKDPRISVLTAFWKQALERQGFWPAFVIMVRNPNEIAASLAKRDGFSIERGLLLWLTNMLAAEQKSRGSRRVFVDFEQLFEDPSRVLDRVEAMTGRPLPRRTRAANLEVQRALRGDLRHRRAKEDMAPRGELETMASDAFAWLLAAARGEEPKPEKLDDIAARLRACEQVTGGVLAELQAESEGLQQTHADAQTQLAAERSQSERLGEDIAADRSGAASLRAALDDERARAQARLDEAQATEEVKLGVFKEALREEHARTLAAMAEAGEQRQKAEAELASLAEVVADQRGALKNERIRASRLSATMAEMGGRFAEAQRAAAAREESDAQTIGKERRKLEELAKGLEHSRERIIEMEAELATAKDQLVKLPALARRQALAEAEAERAQLAKLLDEERHRSEVLEETNHALATAIHHIQTRPWWRAIGLLKRTVQQAPRQTTDR